MDVEIRQSTLVRAPPERVYAAITTALGMDGWFTSGAAVDARPGGEIRFRLPTGDGENLSTEVHLVYSG